MKRCTLQGRYKNKPQLNPEKMEMLKMIIRLLIDFRNENEFQQYWQIVSVGTCKSLRSS